jgi:membrane protein YqaA with SNARE-associated domain
VQSFINWVYEIALKLGGPGVFLTAFFDSAFTLPPSGNDILVVLMVLRHKSWMPYYVTVATLGSLAGCYLLYVLAAKGGEAFLRKRVKESHVGRVLGLYQRHGLLALMIPALLPPPAPFKLFVLAAGLANLRPFAFIGAIVVARGIRFFALGWLAITYGDRALDLMRTRGPEVALALVAVILAGVLAWWLWNRRHAVGGAV